MFNLQENPGGKNTNNDNNGNPQNQEVNMVQHEIPNQDVNPNENDKNKPFVFDRLVYAKTLELLGFGYKIPPPEKGENREPIYMRIGELEKYTNIILKKRQEFAVDNGKPVNNIPQQVPPMQSIGGKAPRNEGQMGQGSFKERRGMQIGNAGVINVNEKEQVSGNAFDSVDVRRANGFSSRERGRNAGHNKFNMPQMRINDGAVDQEVTKHGGVQTYNVRDVGLTPNTKYNHSKAQANPHMKQPSIPNTTPSNTYSKQFKTKKSSNNYMIRSANIHNLELSNTVDIQEAPPQSIYNRNHMESKTQNPANPRFRRTQNEPISNENVPTFSRRNPQKNPIPVDQVVVEDTCPINVEGDEGFDMKGRSLDLVTPRKAESNMKGRNSENAILISNEKRNMVHNLKEGFVEENQSKKSRFGGYSQMRIRD
jgi:hypothetical protein